MFWPNLRSELDKYVKHLQEVFKDNVQVRTGALQRSIVVRCAIGDDRYSMAIDLNYYWKWLVQPIVVKAVFETAGLPDPDVYTRYSQNSGFARYQNLRLGEWQKRLNAAYEKDILFHLRGNKNV